MSRPDLSRIVSLLRRCAERYDHEAEALRARGNYTGHRAERALAAECRTASEVLRLGIVRPGELCARCGTEPLRKVK